MPFIGAVIGAISSVLSGIFSVISSIIGSIVSVIGSIVGGIISAISAAVGIISKMLSTGVGSVLSKITNSLSFISVIKDIGNLVKPLITAYQFARDLFSGFSAVYNVITSLKNIIGTVFKPIAESIRMLFNQVYYIWERLFAPIRPIIDRLKNVYIAIRNSIIGQIIQRVKVIAEYISLIHTLSKVYYYVKEEKYAKAIFLLAYHFDETLKNETKMILEAVSSDIQNVIVELRKTLSLIKSDIDGVARYSFILGNVIEDIGKNLGVKSIYDIGDYIKTNVIRNVEFIRQRLDSAYKEITNRINYVADPLFRALSDIYRYEREEVRIQRIYRYLTLEHLHKELTFPTFDSRWYLIRARI